MKIKVAIFAFSCCALLHLNSCEPYPAGEGITLSEMKFQFNVQPDSAYLKLGDTLFIESAIPSTIDGVKLIDGDVILGGGFSYSSLIPINNADSIESCLEGVHFDVIKYSGNFRRLLSSKPNFLSDYIYSINGTEDSILFKYGFVFLKTGVYIFTFAPSFYEGKKGKARTSATFDAVNMHWELYDFDNPNPTPSNPGYYKSYLVAVTE